jgi:hypothetical protein
LPSLLGTETLLLIREYKELIWEPPFCLLRLRLLRFKLETFPFGLAADMEADGAAVGAAGAVMGDGAPALLDPPEGVLPLAPLLPVAPVLAPYCR